MKNLFVKVAFLLIFFGLILLYSPKINSVQAQFCDINAGCTKDGGSVSGCGGMGCCSGVQSGDTCLPAGGGGGGGSGGGGQPPPANSTGIIGGFDPAAWDFEVGVRKDINLLISFQAGSSSEKLSYLKVDVSFSNLFLNVVPQAPIIIYPGNFSRILRVDTAQMANNSGRIIIELEAPGGGPTTGQTLILATIPFFGRQETPTTPKKEIFYVNVETRNHLSNVIPFVNNTVNNFSYIVRRSTSAAAGTTGNTTGSIGTSSPSLFTTTTNQEIQLMMDKFMRKEISAIDISQFISRLDRVSGLQKANWNLCDPYNEICLSFYTYDLIQ